jgi:hypothetical protein
MQIHNFVGTSMPQLFPNVGGEGSESHLFDLNQSDINKWIKVTHYGFIILAVSGLVCLGYGIVAKKQNPVTTEEEFPN